MPFVRGILAAAVSAFFVQLCFDQVYPQLASVMQYGSNLQDLRDRVTTLRADIDRIDLLVNAAKDRGENVDSVVLDWLGKANGISQDVDRWDTEIVNLSQKWWHVLRLDWWSRLSKSAKKMADGIAVVQNEVKSVIDAISRPAHILCVEDIPTSDFIPLASSTAAIQRIMDKVKDEMITHIGVWGREGVGKTTLIMQVAKQAAAAKLFDTVAIATVSRSPDQKVIQNSIAEFFGFKIKIESEHLRRSRLPNILKQKKKILIILDDVWERLDLGEVGIPYGNDHKGCKIIVISRSVRVCDDMETNANVLVQELSEQDALVLFKKKAAIPDSHVLDRGVEELIKQLGGIPNSIIKAGRASRNKPPDQWIDAIREVRDSTSVTIRQPPLFELRLTGFRMDNANIISEDEPSLAFDEESDLDYSKGDADEEYFIEDEASFGFDADEEYFIEDEASFVFDEVSDELSFDRVSNFLGLIIPEARYSSNVIGADSQMTAERRISHDVMDNMHTIIGIYGYWHGIRAMLIKQLAEQVEQRKLFSKVVKIEVPPTADVKIIQDQIALFLGSEIEEEGEYLRRARLSEILKQEHKVLIILDELWERLDLGYIGIPYGNEHKGCKIIVSSPFVEVCNSMETDVSIRELDAIWNQFY